MLKFLIILFSLTGQLSVRITAAFSLSLSSSNNLQLYITWSTVCLPMKIEQTECSETWTYKLQTPGNYPEESIQHTEHGESLKSRIIITCYSKLININNNGTNWVEIFRANLNRVLRQDECLAKDAT